MNYSGLRNCRIFTICSGLVNCGSLMNYFSLKNNLSLKSYFSLMDCSSLVNYCSLTNYCRFTRLFDVIGKRQQIHNESTRELNQFRTRPLMVASDGPNLLTDYNS